MKTIIVPFDYSPAAEAAATYAAGLAAATGHSLLLTDTYQMPANTPDMPVMLISVEELEANAMLQLKSLKETLLLQYPQLIIEMIARPGDLTDELEELCREEPPFAVVTGRHHGGALDRLIEGNTALSVIRSIQQPVFVVPDTVNAFRLQHIVLAADKDITEAQVEKAAAIALGSALQTVYIQTEEEKQTLPASYQVVKADSFIEGIQSYIASNPVDLIIIFPHRHNLIERLFYTSHTEELVNKLEVPVLCLR